MSRHIGSRWTAQRFGRKLASELAARIPGALRAGVERQSATQAASELKYTFAFGGAWLAIFEELCEHLMEVEGVELVKLRGRPVKVVLANNILLLPYRYGTSKSAQLNHPGTLSKVNKTTRELLELYGPDPSLEEPTLVGLEFEKSSSRPEVELLPGRAPDGVVHLFYTANHRQGLLQVGWGELMIDSHKNPRLRTAVEDLPLTSSVPTTLISTTLKESTTQPPDNFSAAPLPTPSLNARPVVDQMGSNPITAEPSQGPDVAEEER